MEKIKVKNLDEIYSFLKNLASELKVTGWAAEYNGVCFYEATTLLGWFLKNTSALKAGVKDLPVASAYGDGNGYSIYEDTIHITTTPTNSGLLVVIKVTWYKDNGYHDYSGRYATESGEEEKIFLLKYKE